jgi:Ca-activated chloride channel family protein
VLANFHFLRPEWFLLLIPFAAITYLQWRTGDYARQWQAVIAPHLLPKMIVRGSQRRLFSPLWVSALVIPLLVIALAGPSWSRGESPFAVDSAALVIAMDLSDSMSSEDLQPDRMQRARSKVLELAKARGDAYTALLAYAGSGHMVLPLSDDRNLLLHYLDALYVGMLPKEGKSPELNLPIVRKLLTKGKDQNSATLLIVTDGASQASIDAFKELGKASGMQVIVWGMGKTVDEMNKDAERGLENSALPLQEAELKKLASAAAGSYQRVSASDDDVKQILSRINRHYELSEDSSRPWIDSGYYFVGPIMLLFLLWFRQGWSLKW